MVAALWIGPTAEARIIGQPASPPNTTAAWTAGRAEGRRRWLTMLRLLGMSSALALSLCGPAFACGLGVFTPLPPGPVPPLVQTPICKYFQNAACEFRFGLDRRLRIPADLLHPMGASRVQAPTGDYESFLINTTWGRLHAVAGRPGPAPGDEALVQVHFTSQPRTGMGSLRGRLEVSAPEQLPAVEAACAQGDATLAFPGRHGVQWELVFQDGRQSTERYCQPGFQGTPGVCTVYALRGGLLLDFWYDRRIEPPTEDIVALVAALLDSLIVDGPKLQLGGSDPLKVLTPAVTSNSVVPVMPKLPGQAAHP